LQVVGGGGADGAFTKLAAALVDGNDRVGALVRVDPQDHHGRVSSHRGGRGTGPVGGHGSMGGTPRSYQATPIGPRRCCGPHNGNWPRGHRALERTRNTEQPAINQTQPDIDEHWLHLKTSNPISSPPAASAPACLAGCAAAFSLPACRVGWRWRPSRLTGLTTASASYVSTSTSATVGWRPTPTWVPSIGRRGDTLPR